MNTHYASVIVIKYDSYLSDLIIQLILISLIVAAEW